jgi:hypothetical protein
VSTWREFRTFWILFAAAVVFVTCSLGRYWHLRFDETELLVCTPWGGFWLAHEAYDRSYDCIWTGILIFRRIPGSEPPRQIYRDVFRHELKRQYP